MTTMSRTTNGGHSKESLSNGLTRIDEWLALAKVEKASSATISNSKLNSEIHSAIVRQTSNYASTLCDNLFTLYRDVEHRPFVLQFLPSFVTAYYDVLYQHRESADVTTTKDVCSTIDTFLVGLYNLGVIDDGHNEKIHEFRIPNLALPSIYHTPNPDHYAHIPLTQHAVSKHEKRCEVIRLQSFAPFDSVTATTREQILWFLLIQYGANVSITDIHSRQAYFHMCTKLVGQGFNFDNPSKSPAKQQKASILPPTGRRIHISSRIMSEMLGTLFYFKANSADQEAAQCMRLLKQRAEYEMYAEVILMTESMGYLHEFESQRAEQQDTIGIEIELPPTVDMVRQKRTATTTRSIKHRQRSSKVDHHHQSETGLPENQLPTDTIEHLNFVPAPSDAKPASLTPPLTQQRRSIFDVLDENSPTTELIHSNSLNLSINDKKSNQVHDDDDDVMTRSDRDITLVVPTPTSPSSMASLQTTRMSAESSTTPLAGISASIGPATSSPSPSSTRHFKPMSLTSTQVYFQTIHQQPHASPSPPVLQHVRTVIHGSHHLSDNDEEEATKFLERPRTSSLRSREKKDVMATVRFAGKTTDDNGEAGGEETYL